MKTKTIILLATLTTMLFPVLSTSQVANNNYSGKSNLLIKDSEMNASAIQSGKFFWGEINAGYSNHGTAGSLALNYRAGKHLFGARYYKSHICYDDNKKRKYFLNDDNSDNHKSIESMSVFSGIVFPGKWTPSISFGVSLIKFNYVSTTCIEHNVTVPRIWETIIDRDYTEEKLSSRTIYAIGIPVELKMHFNPQHFVGFDAGLKADLNMHSTLISAEIGIRLGKLITK